jgi:hypothetical protein
MVCQLDSLVLRLAANKRRGDTLPCGVGSSAPAIGNRCSGIGEMRFGVGIDWLQASLVARGSKAGTLQ